MNWFASMANYYAEVCVRCGKKLEIQPDGRHEDENDRGYCMGCFSYRVRGTSPDYSGAQNFASQNQSQNKNRSGDHEQ